MAEKIDEIKVKHTPTPVNAYDELVAAAREAELLTDRMSNPAYGFRADMKTVQRDCYQLRNRLRTALAKVAEERSAMSEGERYFEDKQPYPDMP